MTSSSKTLAALVKEHHAATGVSIAAYAARVRISPNNVSDAMSGKLEKSIPGVAKKGNSRKKLGLGRTVARLVAACGEDPREWLARFELPCRDDGKWKSGSQLGEESSEQKLQKLRSFKLNVGDLEFLIGVLKVQPTLVLTPEVAMKLVEAVRGSYKQDPTGSS